MEGWPSKKLYDLIDIMSGFTPRTSREAYWDGDIPWLTMNDLIPGLKNVSQTARSVTMDGVRAAYGKLLPAGGVILSARGTVGLVGVIDRDMAFNQSCYGLMAKPDILDQNFLYYLIKMVANELMFMTHGSVFDTITMDTFKEIAVTVPPLEVQRQIAYCLSILDEKIEILSHMNLTLEALAEHEYLGRVAKMPGDTVSLEELANIHAGKPMRKEELKPDGAYRVVGAAGVIGRADKHLFDTDILTTGRVGTLGKVFMFKAPEKLWVTENAFAIRDVKYFHLVYFVLKTGKFGGYYVGSSHRFLRRDDLANLEVRLPPQDVILEFEDYAGALFTKIHANNEELGTLAKLRDFLMPKLVNGELRLDME